MESVQPPAHQEVEVAVIGCGPVGALTANLLGARGVSTLVVERSATPHGQPRAFSCDDEALRVYQQAGLLDEVRDSTIAPPLVEYVNGAGRVFARMKLSETDFGYGHAPLRFFDQPRLEGTLRAGLDRFPHVRLALGTELVGLTQDEDGVTVLLSDPATGQRRAVRARYVLGCDGARSATRAAVRIPLSGASYAEPWLAVSGDVPSGAVRVPDTTFVCDWRRPAFVSPGAAGSYRMEFMLRPGETEDEMQRPETIAALVSPYVDPDRFAVTRAVVYTFHHLVAQRWREGRVFLLGDAAHQMPPFMGQGLCSGLRDAANLSWKLSLVLSGAADPAVLDTYETERRPHTVEMARTSVRLGHVFLARNRVTAALRDTALRAVQTIPRVRRFVERFEFKPVPAYRRGLMAGGRRDGVVGTMFPQPRVLVPGAPGERLLDEVLGDGFVVLGAVGVDGPSLPSRQGLPVRFVAVHPSGTPLTALPDESGDGGYDRVDVVDAEGVLGGWLRRHGAELVVLRPDRFVFSLVRAGGAERAARDLSAALGALSDAPGEPKSPEAAAPAR
ncbi:bifunctional 3-(3-hydroxy-phenyl)propionate/3-hydroxycinnamic acid hydroxylase [Micromonospora sp. C28ISP2-4]|uniref:bifunctional 3-(3-hydroxy-phenyl)propionate/3-hydroxycinnamic acid hydroxylase MhpA n=1 Tax=Micromonospora sp. C28ISP2-4 TaxID=3059523 RepID=UPI0026766071|nr:bifunctional 3-(3-hydroxy-phenyl)propionate/3-hydroxycinnamic acid hydroxylase [Micromonospora sp. C28ISP2-4]MDO3686614.1 bifunctional 3-(3-hydroxy-phenyl)propionate/3-hydroxycinnamic acid hydroxylase [Micromonospora sp. C28ISP2-4]